MATLATLGAFLGAARAVIENAPLVAARRPGTPLRVLCIAAIDYLHRRSGRRLSPDRRQALANGLDLGALVNDHFDQQPFDVERYRALRRELGRSPIDRATSRRFLTRLAPLERGRPQLDQGNAVADASGYRRAVLAACLDFVLELAHDGPSPSVPYHVRSALLGLLDLLQMVDDLLDWARDEAAALPSYVTVLARSTTAPGQRMAVLRGLFDRAYVEVASPSADTQPLRVSAWVVRAIGRGLLVYRRSQLSRPSPCPRPPRLIVGSGGPLLVRRERLRDAPRARILYASDLHLRRGNERAIACRLLAIARRERPDVILLGGDLVDSRSGLEPLTALVGRLGLVAVVAAVEGNHDRWTGATKVRAAVLQGGGRWLPDTPLSLAGSLTVYGALPLGTVPKDSVLCAHHPTAFDTAYAKGFNVVLAGHLHGGQFVFAERGGVFYPGALMYRYNGLRFERGRTTMMVSRGVHDTLPLRWNCPREVLLVEM